MAKNPGKLKNKTGGKNSFMKIALLFTAVVFMPTTIILLMGMIPTIVAAVVDRTGKGTKAITVGSMNLAGCTPFLIDLWTKGHTPDVAVMIISDPAVMSVIYAAAGAGYMINWAMSGIVGTVMVQRGGTRMKDIVKRKEALIERWGREVTGEIPLDAYGFPLETEEKNKSEVKSEKEEDKKTDE